jgi:hypothetical protein
LQIHGDDAHARIIDRHLELMRVTRRVSELHMNAVLAVEREVRADHGAAARADGRSIRLKFLIELIRQAVHIDERWSGSIADRNPAQLLCGRQILLQLCRRHEQQIGDVVETAAGIVGGQEEIEIDILRQLIECEEIANRILVLRARQTM